MKTKTQSFPKRLAASLVFILAASSVLTACPGKGGGGDAPPPGVVGITACVQCAGIAATTLVPNAITSNSTNPYFPVSISWQILGDANMIARSQQMTYGYVSPAGPWKTYQGPMILRGGITFANQVIGIGSGGYAQPYGQVPYGQPYAQGQIYPGQPYGQPYGAVQGQCLIPAGAYTFDTVSPGQMIGGEMRAPLLEAVGPVRFRFQVRGRLIDPYATGTMVQLSADIAVLSVNDIPCSNIRGSVQ